MNLKRLNQLRNKLIKKGLALDSILFKSSLETLVNNELIKDQKRNKEKWQRLKKDPVLLEKYYTKNRLRNREHYKRTKEDLTKLEARRKRDRERKQKLRQSERELTNAKQRDYYKRNSANLRALIYKGKDRRNPIRGLNTIDRKFKSGEIGFREYVRGYKSAIIQFDALTNGISGTSLHKRRGTNEDTD